MIAIRVNVVSKINYTYYIVVENKIVIIFIVSIPKIILLVGGDITIAEPIHRFLSTPVDRRKFGLVIIRVIFKKIL